MRRLFLFLCLALLAAPSWAQRQRDPLNDKESDEVAEVADRPVERIKLYIKFIDQRVASIKQLKDDRKAQNRSAQMHSLLGEFTRLVDELAENLDTYDEHKSDMRKGLKDLVPASTRWLELFNGPAPQDSLNDFARKTAYDAAQSLSEQSKKLQSDQELYFNEHKKERNKNGTGPS